MKARWGLILLPSVLVSLGLLVLSQFIFIRGSFHRDIGLGQLDERFELVNYLTIFADPYYLKTLGLSVQVSGITTALTVVTAFPVAYIIARLRSPRLVMTLLTAVVAASFVTIVIKVLGLIFLFSPEGFLNKALIGIGLVNQPISILGNVAGIVTGLMYYSLGFAVLLFYSVVITIPRSLEEAAQILGASPLRAFFRVIVPLSLPGIVGGALMVFNISMGGFASTALLGVGKVLTLPVIVQRTVIVETYYGMGAALAVVLLVSVMLINLVSVLAVAGITRGRRLTP